MMNSLSYKFIQLIVFLLVYSHCSVLGQVTLTDSLHPELGTLSFETSDFQLELLKNSQIVAALRPRSAPEFNFTPGEWLPQRKKAGYYHLGDINLKLRTAGTAQWESYSSATVRNKIMTIKVENKSTLAIADLTSVFPQNLPLKIIRSWKSEYENLVLQFDLENISNKEIEIGALGIPMIFNNNHSRKTLDEAHAENVFYDPYIGLDAGYLQVVRLKGTGKVLLVVPESDSPFEAWRPLLEDPTPRGITFEGFHEWMIHSKAYAENEWQDADPWNPASSAKLKPGERKIIGVKFLLADSVKDIENTLIENNRPVAVGIPGYVLPLDVNASLFINYPGKIQSIEVDPENALNIEFKEVTDSGWRKYLVKGERWGRARLTILYEDGNRQTINYKVIKPEEEVVADNGHFLTTAQWFEADNDPFGRSPSVITYDYEEKKQVTQDSRAWICGLSDEGGAGSWLNAVMKQLVLPNPEEVNKLEDFIQQTLWGGIQYSDGPLKYGVRKSLFYYEPDSMPTGTYHADINYTTWAAWNKEHAETVERSYNYPHVAAAHWVMYRLARNYSGLVKQQKWDWYLQKAFQTAVAMVDLAPHYAQFGQMEGSVFLHILADLKAEGWWEQARQLEQKMKIRTDHWASLNYPFGSEMPWDSTGQEEVFMWSDYFGYAAKALTTLHAILAYMPAIPHWAYNGNARRYWDFLYGGKLTRIERQIHHYGSGLNAIPVLKAYRNSPDDLYILRIGYGGLLGALSNITMDGFAPAAFHSFPSTLKIDGISGDYGPGFYGYAINSATFVSYDKEFGWLAFGGNARENNHVLNVEMTTASKSRLFIAPIQMWITMDAGQIESFSLDTGSGDVVLQLKAANTYTPRAYLRIEQVPGGNRNYRVNDYQKNQRGQYDIPLTDKAVQVKIN